MINNVGYQSNQPLSFNNSNNLFYNPNQNIFGGNNPGMNLMGYQNPVMMNPANNVQQWLFDAANRVLLDLVNTGRLTRDQANYVGSEISNKSQQWIAVIAQGTNNFTNVNQQVITNIAAQIVQKIVDDKKAEMFRSLNADLTAMNNAAMLANAAGSSINPAFNINQSPDVSINNLNKNIRYNGTPPRKAKFRNNNAVNEQIQQYANAVASPTVNNNNNQNNNREIIIDAKPVESKPIIKQSNTYSIDDDANSPIQIKHNKYVAFDPDDKSTWSIELYKKYVEIGNKQTNAPLKRYLAHCAVCEAYWESKGIIWWLLNDSFELSRAVQEVHNTRATLPATLPTITPLKESDKDGYAVTINDKPFMDCDTEAIDLITLSQNSNTKCNLMYARLSKDEIVVNEKEFIDECTNGQLKQIKLTKPSEVSLDVIREQRSIAITIDYELAIGVDVPYDLFNDYYKQFTDIVVKYGRIFNIDKLFDRDTCIKYVKEIIRCLYSIPRKWSERIDKLITEYLNEAMSRNLRHISKGIANAPYFKNWINIMDIIDGGKYNLIESDSNFSKNFFILIHQVLHAIFTGYICNPDTEVDLLTLIDCKDSKNLLTKYYGDDLNYNDVMEWKNDADTFENKIEHLKKRIKKYSVISIHKDILITDIMPNIKYAKEYNTWIMYPMDNHLDPFEYVIARSYDNNNIFKNAIVINNELKTKIQNPIPYYKLNHTLDNYIGKMLIPY